MTSRACAVTDHREAVAPRWTGPPGRGTLPVMTANVLPASAGRVVIDRAGMIIEADGAFDAAMRSDVSLVGTDALILTAPADRDRCAALVAQLCADGVPVSTVKRMIRGDGTHIWLRNSMTLIPGTDPRIAIDLLECPPPPGWIEPSLLLDTARVIFGSRRERGKAFGDDLFSDPAWDMLLAAYISEAEGSVATIARIHAWTAIPLAVASRWIRALSVEGLLEYEDGGNHQLVTTPFRLTSAAHGKFEAFLSTIYDNRTAAAQLALPS